MDRKTQMSAGIRRYLETGYYGSSRDPARSPFDYDAFGLAGAVHRGNATETVALWDQYGAALLEDWLRAHPGCRPFGWWISEARVPRRVLRGTALRVGGPTREEIWWRRHFGVPFFLQVRPAGFIGYPAIESEATYLKRLALLTDDERARVPEGDWAPEAINPFLIDDRAVLDSTHGAPRRPDA
jgi:hypothetical protein